MSRRERNLLRKRQVIRNRTILGIGLLLICIVVLWLFIGGRMVTASNPTETYKYYTEFKVHPGDTLWDIAREYMSEEYDSEKDYIQEVKEINSIYGDEIYYGQRLMVPYYSEELK